MNLKNRVALISGGARMGEAVAIKLAQKGCQIVMTYRSSREETSGVLSKVQDLGVKSLMVRADVSCQKDIRLAIEKTLKKFGHLDILINMASVYHSKEWDELNENNWQLMMDSNLKSYYLLVLEAATALKKSRGRVVNIADWLAASGRPRYKKYVAYYTSKMGVIGLTQALALELAPRVLVNSIAPGPILPPAGSSKRDQDEVKEVTPLHRWGGAEEIAKAVVFLCETDFVTGECLRVDGGRHLY